MANGASSIKGRIILSAVNQTGPMFAEIEAQIQGLNKSLGALAVPRLDTSNLQQQLTLIEQVGDALTSMHRQAGQEVQSVQSLYDEFVQGFAQGMQAELKELGPAFQGTFADFAKMLQEMDLSKDLFEGFAEGISDELRKQTPDIQRAFEGLSRHMDFGRLFGASFDDVQDSIKETFEEATTSSDRFTEHAVSNWSKLQDAAKAYAIAVPAAVAGVVAVQAAGSEAYRGRELSQAQRRFYWERSPYPADISYEGMQNRAKTMQANLRAPKQLEGAYTQARLMGATTAESDKMVEAACQHFPHAREAGGRGHRRERAERATERQKPEHGGAHGRARYGAGHRHAGARQFAPARHGYVAA